MNTPTPTLRCRAVVWLLTAFSSLASLHAAERKPNFLFIFTDDHRWDAMAVVQREQGERARFPWFKSPNMDRLAAEGVRFRNAFVTLSLCAPSRAAFLTGRYNHLNGITDNGTPFRRHKTWVHEGGISSPLIVHWPAGISAKGALRHTPDHVVDIVPTVLELAGAQKPKEWNGEPIPEAPGRSLVPAFAKDVTIPHDSLW